MFWSVFHIKTLIYKCISLRFKRLFWFFTKLSQNKIANNLDYFGQSFKDLKEKLFLILLGACTNHVDKCGGVGLLKCPQQQLTAIK